MNTGATVSNEMTIMKRHGTMRWGAEVSLMLIAAGCRQPTADAPADNISAAGPPPAPAPVLPPPKLEIPIINPDPDRWLFVEKEKEGTRGGHATGSFDNPKNKITVNTVDVIRFVIDTSRIEIDWTRPVVLGIDQRNYELRRRDNPLIRFERSANKEWTVLEP